MKYDEQILAASAKHPQPGRRFEYGTAGVSPMENIFKQSSTDTMRLIQFRLKAYATLILCWGTSQEQY